MKAQIKFEFEDNQEKKDMNLRVIRRTCKEHNVLDYSAVLPCCSVYQTNKKNEWEKCDIFGPLFILSASDISFPILYILNTVSIDDLVNFQLIFDPCSVSISMEDKKIFFKICNTEKNYCISTYSSADAKSLFDTLSRTYSYTHDPTYKHLSHYFSKH